MPATITVDQAKLVLNSFATIFQNNLVSTDLVSWSKFEPEMNDRNALTVVEQKVPRYVVTKTVNAVQDLTSSGTQSSVFGSEQFKVDTIFGSSMGWQDFVKIRDIGAARESEALKMAALNLAEQIDAYILGFAVNASNNYTGTAGNAVQLYNDVASGYTRLKEEGAPDSDLRAVLTYGDKQALGAQVLNMNAGAQSGNASLTNIGDGVYRNGWEGSIAGIKTLFTQQLPSLATGTHGTSSVTGAAQNVNYSAVAVSGAPGQYMTQTLVTSIGAGTETAKDGEVFTIAGVFAYDNRLQASLGRLQQFRVVGDVAATGGAVTMRIFPAIIVPGSGTGNDININTAHATVTAAPAGGAAITWVTPASSVVKPRAILNKDAIVVNTADLIIPATGIGSRKSLTKLPLSVRMWQNSVFNTGEHQVRFDVALAANVRDRRMITRINGA